MTANSLISAVSVGLVIGLAGRRLAGRGRSVPLWLPVAAAIGAAVLVAVITGTPGAGPTLTEVFLQALFAAAGVAVVTATADRSGDVR